MGILWTKKYFCFLKFLYLSSWYAFNFSNPKQEKQSRILNNLCISISSFRLKFILALLCPTSIWSLLVISSSCAWSLQELLLLAELVLGPPVFHDWISTSIFLWLWSCHSSFSNILRLSQRYSKYLLINSCFLKCSPCKQIR